ncbi:MAG: hypothetical protein ABW061_03255 [Polyangiaceae bacterium]
MGIQMVGRTFRGALGVGLCGFWLFALQAGCASSSDGAAASCKAACTDLCQALAACDDGAPSDCEAQCNLGTSGVSCSGVRPADQLTCNELSASYACADYCATLCTRAPSCGSFAADTCARGCASQSHSICNSKSVAARTCDQLKPELRLYDDAGNAGQGEIVVGGGFGAQYGLCTSATDCDLPLGCSATTNTCSPCEADADCGRTYPHYACSTKHECTKVDCVVDADCSASLSSPTTFCDASLHVCGECHVDADCKNATLGKVCDEKTLKCVECVDNGDCSKDSPRCDESLQYCSYCKVDKDCAGYADAPYCETLGCVACRADTDCTDVAHPTCNYRGACE